MIPPKMLWIGTFEFPVHMVPASDPKLDGANGLTFLSPESQDLGIWINESMPPRKLLEVVLHEITHAINWAHEFPGTKRYTEERLATAYGVAWSALLIDNPKLQRWLTYMGNRIRKERKDA